MKLLSTANAKLEKSLDFGYMSFGLSLAPHTLSGKNFCPHASPGCIAACLNTAGMGRFSNVQKARVEKSKFFINDRQNFISQLKKEIVSAKKTAEKKGFKVSVRLNVISDLPWENLLDMESFQGVQFMDYTPNPKRMIQFINGEMPKNYHLTFSRKENNHAVAELISKMGGNVAVVFKNVPGDYLERPVVDGDISDLRFLDPKGCIVGLKAKGDAKKDDSGFVVI